jgi:hypothetical protein
MERDVLIGFVDAICLEAENDVIAWCKGQRKHSDGSDLMRAVIQSKETWQREVLEYVRRIAREKVAPS